MSRPRRALPRSRRAPLALVSACGGGGGEHRSAGATERPADTDDREAAAGGDAHAGARRGPGRARPDARAHAGRPRGVRQHVREALRRRRGPRARPAARRRAARGLRGRHRPSPSRCATASTFNDGTPFDAEAVKTSLDRHRTLEGSARRGRPRGGRVGRGRRPDDRARSRLNGAVRPAHRAARRPGRHDHVADAARRRSATSSAPTRSASARSPFVSRTAGSEIVLEKAAGLLRRRPGQARRPSRTAIITDGNVRQANVKSGDVQVAERIAADRRGGARERHRGASSSARSRSATRASRSTSATSPGVSQPVRRGRHPARQLARAARGLRAVAGPRRASTRSCSPASTRPAARRCRRPAPTTTTSIECTERDLDRAKELIAGSPAQPTPVPVDADRSARARRTCGSARSSSRRPRRPASRSRSPPTEFASALDASDAGDFDTFQVGWSGRVDPDGNIYNFLAHRRVAEHQRLLQPRGRRRARAGPADRRPGRAHGSSTPQATRAGRRGPADHLPVPPGATTSRPARTSSASSTTPTACRGSRPPAWPSSARRRDGGRPWRRTCSAASAPRRSCCCSPASWSSSGSGRCRATRRSPWPARSATRSRSSRSARSTA